MITLALLWVKARGKFIFLDNVIQNRTPIVEPWNRFRKQGNSLFLLWIVCLGLVLIMLVAIGALVAFSDGSEWFGWIDSKDFDVGLPIFVGVFLSLICLVVVATYVAYFLDAFVVPLMHRYDLNARQGCTRFLDLFRRRPVPFLLSGLFVLVLSFGVGIAVVAAGLLTCCFGFILLLIPYVGTVVLLPIPVVYRLYTLEFLAQFHPDLLIVSPTSQD